MEAVLAEMRTTGSPKRVRAELATRERALRQRGLLRLRATAAGYGYLRYRGTGQPDASV